jgi:hypothetical protein
VREETRIADLIIPANTVIVFQLLGERPQPREIIDKHGALTEAAQRQRTILEFGLGARQCPAFHVAEKVLKIYVSKYIESDFKPWSPYLNKMPVYENPARQLQATHYDLELYINVALVMVYGLDEKRVNGLMLKNINKLVNTIFFKNANVIEIADEFGTPTLTKQMRVQLKLPDVTFLDILSKALKPYATEERAKQRELAGVEEKEFGPCMTLSSTATPELAEQIKMRSVSKVLFFNDAEISGTSEKLSNQVKSRVQQRIT